MSFYAHCPTIPFTVSSLVRLTDWGLRDYSVDGQIGLEETLEEFIDKLVVLFREARRVLHPMGTCWINMGDSYNGSQQSGGGGGRLYVDGGKKKIAKQDETFKHLPPTKVNGLKPKDLIGQPWRRWMGCELNPDYIKIANKRLQGVNVDMFTSAGLDV